MIGQDQTTFAPLCLDALSARVAEQAGFQHVYVSGGALGYAHAVSEALLELGEIADVVRHITARSQVSVIADAGVGFGDAVHMSRVVEVLEAAGAAAIEIEDQVAPKRVSHHRGIEQLIPCDEMMQKIEVACTSRQNTQTQIIARTGAVKNESLESAVQRCQRYVDAGADLILIMAGSETAWRHVRENLSVPIVTFAPLGGATIETWSQRGVSLVCDPFTTQVAHVINMQQTYRRFFAGEAQLLTTDELFETYNELGTIAGFDKYYDIEDATTLK